MLCVCVYVLHHFNKTKAVLVNIVEKLKLGVSEQNVLDTFN